VLKKAFILFFLSCASVAVANSEVAVCDVCNPVAPPTRTDELPLCSVDGSDDQFLTGYLQALVDMNYYEFQVQVVVENGIAYVSHLPNNDLIAHSIMCFIYDVPCIEDVQCVDVRDECCCSPGVDVAVLEPFCCPYGQVNGIWFPNSTVLFAPLIADPRQVTNSAALRFNDNVIGKHVGAVSFGDEFVFYRWRDIWRWHGDLEAGIEAGIFAVFDMDHPEACHVNTDFFVSTLLNYAFDAYSFRLRIWHQSSHLGDEFLICNPGYPRKNLSDEGIDLFVSYQLCQPVRLYGGLGDIFERDKEFPEKPVYFEFGTEVRVFGDRDYCRKVYMQPFLAMHFRTWQEHNWDLDQTYALGMEWSKLQGIGRKLRIFGEYHEGYSKDGQFVRFRTNYAAIRLTYGF
jgi:hypothetical protein